MTETSRVPGRQVIPTWRQEPWQLHPNTRTTSAERNPDGSPTTALTPGRHLRSHNCKTHDDLGFLCRRYIEDATANLQIKKHD